MPPTSLRAFVMAVDRVEARLKRAAAALDRAGVRYAVVGGNAVAAWVARVDPGATRTTKNVDVLVRRADLNDVTRSLETAGFQRQDLRNLVLFIDPAEPSRRAGVHLVWAGEPVRPSYVCPAPGVDEGGPGPGRLPAAESGRSGADEAHVVPRHRPCAHQGHVRRWPH